MMTFRFKLLLKPAAFLALALIAAIPAFAGEADVVDASILRSPDGSFRFDVALSHADTGWEHYAIAFEILDSEGTILGTRTLLHPHVNEQPFTRSLSGVTIPDEVTQVTIRGRDNVHDIGGIEMILKVPAP